MDAPPSGPCGDNFVPSQRKETASPQYGGAPDPADTGGFAAAYRAVTPPGDGPAAPGTQQFQMPANMQPTQTFPRVDNGGNPSSWPVPSPPPVGEAPASAYDPLQDTGYTTPVYGNSPMRRLRHE